LVGSWGLGLTPFLPLWGWLQLALLIHLITDVLFYRWPVQLLWPFSPRGWGLGLVSWNDLVPTLILYGATALALARPPLPASAAPVAGRPLPAAAAGLAGLALYTAWRARRPRPRSGWAAWLTGDWARGSFPLWRWLTGDFVT